MASFAVSALACCGIKELSNISALPNPEAIVRESALKLRHITDYFAACPAFLLFSGVVKDRAYVYPAHYHPDRSDNYAKDLSDYIVANKLGSVSVSQEGINHSRNVLQVFIWAPDWDKMKAVCNDYLAQLKTLSAEPSLSVEPSLTITNVSGETVVSVNTGRMNF